MKNILISVLSLFFVSQIVNAADCADIDVTIGATRYQRHQVTPSECFLSVDLDNVPSTLVYRSYLATNDGEFMVFNSYGDGPESTSAGARVFFFFPRGTNPNVITQNNQASFLVGSQNVAITVDSENGNLLSLTNGSITVDPNINRINKGGVEIKNYKGLYLDSGYKLGSDPTSDKSAESTFIDQNGQSCKTQNSEIFNYTANGNVFLKYSDTDLSTFLKKRCPDLVVTF